MGQTLWCYDFCWFNQCRCVGLSCSFFICNCWMCIPQELEFFRGGECLKCGGCNNGYGYTLLCAGGYCCIPEWLKLYSIRSTIHDFRGPLNDVEIISRSQPAPYSNNHMYGR